MSTLSIPSIYPGQSHSTSYTHHPYVSPLLRLETPTPLPPHCDLVTARYAAAHLPLLPRCTPGPGTRRTSNPTDTRPGHAT
jgi:hypothetical protein